MLIVIQLAVVFGRECFVSFTPHAGWKACNTLGGGAGTPLYLSEA